MQILQKLINANGLFYNTDYLELFWALTLVAEN